MPIAEVSGLDQTALLPVTQRSMVRTSVVTAAEAIADFLKIALENHKQIKQMSTTRPQNCITKLETSHKVLIWPERARLALACGSAASIIQHTVAHRPKEELETLASTASS